MKEILLTKGRLAFIDDEDFDRIVSAGKWKVKRGYAVREYRVNGKWKIVLMHRLILNPPAGVQVDHINHDKLDNQKMNLRLCDNRQNQWNRDILPGKSFKGIHFNKQCQKWESSIRVNGKKHHLGLFPTELLAALAYNEAAVLHFGEFARLNVIERRSA